MPASDEKIADEYIVLMREAYSRYGPRCLILMQVGSFYEVYDNEGLERSTQLQVCEQVLYLKVTSKKVTSVIDGAPKPVYAAGFPDYALQRYKAMLVDQRYTVLIVDQDINDTTIRRLASVVSPGMDDERDENDSAIAILVFANNRTAGARYDAAINRIDVFRCEDDRPLKALEDARMALRERGGATEIHLHICSDVDATVDDENVATIFGNVALHVKRHTKAQRFLYKREWQMRCLESHFRRHNTYGEDILLKLQLQHMDTHSIMAVALLAIFVREHDEEASTHLSLPNAEENTGMETQFLNGSLHGLDVLRGDDGPSLYDMFATHVRTKMGLRHLRGRLCSPVHDVSVLNRMYYEIDAMLALARENEVDSELRQVKDLSQMACTARRGRLRINDLGRFIASHRAALRVIEKTEDVFGSDNRSDIAALEAMLNACDDVLLPESERDGTDCFRNGSRPPFCDLAAVDSARESHLAAVMRLEEIQAKLSESISTPGAVKLTGANDGNFCLVTTIARGRALEQAGVSVLLSKKEARVMDTGAHEACSLASQTRSDLDDACLDAFAQLTRHLKCLYFDQHAEAIANLVGRVDLVHGAARLADRSRHRRPEVVESTHGSIRATRLRHPIIERLVDARGGCYVANDISLDSTHSMLLYGANSVGKSSLLKAVAIGVLMAQVGFFVPADSFRLVPYKAVSLHIGGRDNMYRSQSTFVREIEHLRVVLTASRRVGSRTLFLADELGNSTEDHAAVQIVSTVLHAMYTRASTIVLATHMFSLLDNPRVTSLRGLQTHHLQVSFPTEGGFVFERTLKKGPPDVREYGCEIAARLLEDDPDVCRRLRSGQLTDSSMHALAPRPSRYNKHLYAIHGCIVCGYKPKCPTDKPVAWHHIEEQSTRVNGFVPSGKKVHAASNLMPVCDGCHDEIHAGRTKVVGYEDTSDGPVLRFERIVS